MILNQLKIIFKSGITMFDYIDDRRESMNEFYENEMQRYKETADHVISPTVHSKYSQLISRVIATSYFEENSDAITLANELDLDKVYFFAVLEDLEGFKREFIKDQELAQNF